jgi:hypothetical protein
MNKLYEIIEETLHDFTGGELFFDQLDLQIRKNAFIIQDLFKTIPVEKRKNIICSGKFGAYLVKNIKKLADNNESLILLHGGIRYDGYVNLKHMKDDLRGKEYIFIDDSLYEGRTKNAIKKEIESCGAILTDTYVVYDGSIRRQHNVNSLYRYYK